MKRYKGEKGAILLPGKLPLNLLERFLKRYTIPGERVVVGPGIGLDATVIDLGNRYLLAKTDPITFVAEEIGVYTININANDIAVMGGRPRWFLATILLPEGKTTVEMAEGIFSQLSRACSEIGVVFCGGHTEITFGIDRPIVIGEMLGEVRKDRLVTAAGARIGDDIILTKGIAIETTSIIAREKGEELKKRYPEDFIKRCKGFINRPGIGVLKDAQIAARLARVHAMHDPTEGGLATGLHELAIASGMGIVVDKESIPILPECQRLCKDYGIDPLGAIASGAVLITVSERDSRRVVSGLKRNGITASIIGKVVERKRGVKIREDGKLKYLKIFERDEIVKIF